jgi:hypothetical protein
MVQPGYGQQYGGSPAPQVPNNLTTAIVGLLLFWPVGLFALINATKVNGLVAQGDFAGATEASNQAKKLGKLAIIIGAVLWGLSILACCAGVIISIAASDA